MIAYPPGFTQDLRDQVELALLRAEEDARARLTRLA